jgi:serine/threonine protein kinase
MGAVFLAGQIAVGNRLVAVKVLSRKLLDDPDFLMRFQNEATSTGRIHHANVVTIYESGQADDGTPYIAMEFLEGESLRQALARRGLLPVAVFENRDFMLVCTRPTRSSRFITGPRRSNLFKDAVALPVFPRSPTDPAQGSVARAR